MPKVEVLEDEWEVRRTHDNARHRRTNSKPIGESSRHGKKMCEESTEGGRTRDTVRKPDVQMHGKRADTLQKKHRMQITKERDKTSETFSLRDVNPNEPRVSPQLATRSCFSGTGGTTTQRTLNARTPSLDPATQTWRDGAGRSCDTRCGR